ncbi:DUF1566 domain-containing protein [Pseudomonas asplenii]|uniref:DUF1566 domain-containing protein n=1 Tax=Pseudomonas asplenii TaxID=53407 RepID=A0A1H6NZZ5_9PSED|nr:DUF1566 domain-containing protein [Pseudomonas fuscovaginae]SEI17046.1 hypothetical protein SAMN05216581_3294 [Pseudomonas fuscovaginae]
MQSNQLATYTHGELMISGPDEQVVLKLASLAIGITPAANEAGAPAIGQPWPGEGGVNGGLFPGNGKPYYLIVPTGADAEAKHVFGGYGEELDGANSPHDGMTNTADLVETDGNYPAAQFCSAFERDGRTDFYLMSRREAQFLEITVPEVFSKAYHWTSTQYSANGAYYMDFGDGWLNLLDKVNERLVRPVRRKFI